VQSIGGTAEVQFVGQREEVAQVPDVHGQ
jgi:hypothetical protein